jgi:hypothetical protein
MVLDTNGDLPLRDLSRHRNLWFSPLLWMDDRVRERFAHRERDVIAGRAVDTRLTQPSPQLPYGASGLGRLSDKESNSEP